MSKVLEPLQINVPEPNFIVATYTQSGFRRSQHRVGDLNVLIHWHACRYGHVKRIWSDFQQLALCQWWIDAPVVAIEISENEFFVRERSEDLMIRGLSQG